jgi:hypothetical protein
MSSPSPIVFSFANINPVPGLSDQISITERRAALLGEPFLTKNQPDLLEQKLRGLGFSEILFLIPKIILEE